MVLSMFSKDLRGLLSVKSKYLQATDYSTSRPYLLDKFAYKNNYYERTRIRLKALSRIRGEA
jgi:hypothetical protein